MIAIVTDSCASLPAALTDELGVRTVPYYIHAAGHAWRDGLDLSAADFPQWMADLERDGIWPKTVSPSAGEYLDALRQAGQGASGVLVICMASQSSAGYQSACLAQRLAATELPDLPVEVIDTGQVALGQGWAAIVAARAALHGEPMPVVVAAAQRAARHSFVAFTNPNLRHWQRMGGASRVMLWANRVLRTHPIIVMQAGEPRLQGVGRSFAVAGARIMRLAAGSIAPGAVVRAALMHVGARDRAAMLREQVDAQYDVVEWLEAPLSPVLGIHSGPGTVGLALIPEALPAGDAANGA